MPKSTGAPKSNAPNTPAQPVELDEDLKSALKDIVKSCMDEDKEIRKAMMRQWKKHEEFWHGVQYLFWSERDDSWRSAQDSEFEDNQGEDNDSLGSFSDKVIDIYKAHGESIIAALAAQVPALRFLPDDASSTEDTLTARTYNKIADIVSRHNKAKLVFLRALFFLANQGLVASYRYKDSDFSYGSYKVPEYGVEIRESEQFTCTTCGYQAEQNWMVPEEQEQLALAQPGSCPQCGSTDKPKVEKIKQDVPVLKNIADHPKTRVKLDVFGPLHFKVSYYARNQSECGYFGLFLDQAKDVTMSTYPDLADEIEVTHLEDTDRFARSAYVYPAEQDVAQENLCTVYKWWLRPSTFYRCTHKENRKKLIKKFPDGVRVVLIGKDRIFAEAVPESLDSRWEIGQAGLSTFIYSDPILRPLIQIQEMRNQLVNLIMETINHGIPSEFAHPSVVNFDTYGKFEALPGYIYKAMPSQKGQALENDFYTSNRATLSREVAMFLKQLDQDAQFAIGSFPSIYGGPSEGKSRTFAEYAASRQMALQRLSIVWSMVVDWWTRTIEGCVKMYVECVTEDEKYTKFENGNYITIWIKRSQMQGKVGGVEPEASETFPISLAQKKDLILKLMELNNPFINDALYKPENARVLQDVLALNEMKLPGEIQRVKQVIEIGELLQDGATAIPTGEMGPDGQEIIQSSVPIDPNVDDHAVHISTLQSFMVDLPGLDVLRENPAGYANLTAHLKMHQNALAVQTMSAQGGTPPGAPPETSHTGSPE